MVSRTRHHQQSTKRLKCAQQSRLDRRTVKGQLHSDLRYQSNNNVILYGDTTNTKLFNRRERKGSKVSWILDLPRELRDQIYRGFLLADKVRVKHTYTTAFEPAILRVNQ